MIVKVILDTNQEIEIYNSSTIDNVNISYREVYDGVALGLTRDTTNQLLLYNSWKKLMQNIEDPKKESVKSVIVINDNDEIIFEQNNIVNYLYQATFNHPIKENIDFEILK